MTSFLDEILPRPTLAEGERSPGESVHVTPIHDGLAPLFPVELLGDIEKHTLPNGAIVYYRDRDHSYWRQVKKKGDGYTGSERIPGASTATKPVDFDSSALLRWAAKSNGEGISVLAREALLLDREDWPLALSFLESEETIWEALTERKLTYDDLRQQRAKEGTNVHEQVLQALATDKPLPEMDGLSEKEQGYAKAIISWWNVRHPLPLQSEQVVYSANYGYAGRFDLRARMRHEFPSIGTHVEQTWLIDLKTSGFMSLAMHVQLRAYEEAAIESGFGESDRQLILQVFEDGTWREHVCQATEQNLLNSLAVYRDASDLGKRIRDNLRLAEGEKP